MLIGLVSAKGAPGVTTAALALAATASDDGLLIELDPSGGSIECWTAATAEPGLLRVASALRRATDTAVVAVGEGTNPPGVASVLAPSHGTLAESTIAAMGRSLATALATTDRTVVLDAGRWSRSQPTADRIRGCDHILIVTYPTVAGVEAARALAPSIEDATRTTPRLLLIGEHPYGATEVAEATGIAVAGVLPWDSRSVAALMANGPTRGWHRTPLARAARAALATVTADFQAKVPA
jgi:cellulose biosynthesis protein BcsQ